MIDKPFAWNEEKNQRLQEERGLSFEAIIIAIQNGHLMDISNHPERPNQKIFEVEMEGMWLYIPMRKM